MGQSKWYKSGWTDERRAKQREAIQRWKPWEKSTGPRTPQGKAQAAANARMIQFDLRLKGLSSKQLLTLAKSISNGTNRLL